MEAVPSFGDRTPIPFQLPEVLGRDRESPAAAALDIQ
jgi:hypothetical protein